MRTINYPRWVRPFLGSLWVLGFLGTLHPVTHWMGWGILFQCVFLSLGYVCIYVAELENDLLANARQEVGDWHPLITGLSMHRTHYPAQASTAAALQQLNRQFWRDYLRKRRQVLRENLALDGQKEALQPLHAVGKSWISHIETQLAQQTVTCGPAEAELYAQLQAL